MKSKIFAALLIALALPTAGIAKKHQATSTQSAAQSQTVIYNVKTGKIHRPGCSAAARCTRNCIETTLADAKASGGVNCKICGGR